MSIYVHLKYKTQLTDKEILKKVLKELKVNFSENKEELICNISRYQLHFKKNKTGEYEINTQGYNDWKNDITNFREKITKDYDKLVQKQLQKQILENIKNKIANNKSMKIENEQILEDASVLLTIRV